MLFLTLLPFFAASPQLKPLSSAIIHAVQPQRNHSLDSRAFISVPGTPLRRQWGTGTWKPLVLSLLPIMPAAFAGLTVYQVQSQGVRISVCPVGT